MFPLLSSLDDRPTSIPLTFSTMPTWIMKPCPKFPKLLLKPALQPSVVFTHPPHPLLNLIRMSYSGQIWFTGSFLTDFGWSSNISYCPISGDCRQTHPIIKVNNGYDYTSSQPSGFVTKRLVLSAVITPSKHNRSCSISPRTSFIGLSLSYMMPFDAAEQIDNSPVNLNNPFCAPYLLSSEDNEVDTLPCELKLAPLILFSSLAMLTKSWWGRVLWCACPRSDNPFWCYHWQPWSINTSSV